MTEVGAVGAAPEGPAHEKRRDQEAKESQEKGKESEEKGELDKRGYEPEITAMTGVLGVQQRGEASGATNGWRKRGAIGSVQL